MPLALASRLPGRDQFCRGVVQTHSGEGRAPTAAYLADADEVWSVPGKMDTGIMQRVR